MFRKVHVPLLGLVENMSCFTCPQCGHSEAIFGEGGGAATAAELGMELLGQVGGKGHMGCVCVLLLSCVSSLQEMVQVAVVGAAHVLCVVLL